jgi:hypothetical protein
LPTDEETKHIDQSPPYEWHAMAFDGRTFIVRDQPEGTAQLYVVSAASRNVRTFAKADAALYEGNVVWTHYNDDVGTVEFVHDYAGTVGKHGIESWFDEPAIRLKKIRSGSGDILEAVK